jgi:hypothetical protein
VTRRSTAIKVLAALIGAASCLAAVAYAAGVPVASHRAGSRPTGPKPLRPQILQHPGKPSLSASVAFSYRSRQPGAGFQCRLDSGAWKDCGPRVVYRGLAAGSHSFRVRVESARGALSRPARFSWIQTAPKDFEIQPQSDGLGRLYPGAPAQSLPLRLHNPNPAPILITALRVSLASAPPDCPSSNFDPIPSSASPANPLRIPAGASVTVPTPTVTAPAIALRDLPISQDACQNAQLPLSFSGEAHG